MSCQCRNLEQQKTERPRMIRNFVPRYRVIVLSCYRVTVTTTCATDLGTPSESYQSCRSTGAYQVGRIVRQTDNLCLDNPQSFASNHPVKSVK